MGQMPCFRSSLRNMLLFDPGLVMFKADVERLTCSVDICINVGRRLGSGSGKQSCACLLEIRQDKNVSISWRRLLQLYIRKHVLSAHRADGIATELNAKLRLLRDRRANRLDRVEKDFRYSGQGSSERKSQQPRGGSGGRGPYSAGSFAEATHLTTESVRNRYVIKSATDDDVFLAGRSNPKPFGPPFALVRW